MQKSELDCQFLVVALQDLSNSIQDLAADPSSFVLHRTQCCSLAKSYALTVRHVTQQLHDQTFLSEESASALAYLHQHLCPSLSELHHAMLQGRTFMHDCLYRDGWVKKAVVLALSTEAQDVCLHDLVWCLCVIQQAMGHVVLQRDELESSVYASLNAVWAETSQKQDLDVLLEALHYDIVLSGKNLSTKSRKELDGQCSLANFLFRKLSRKYQFGVDALPWVNPYEFSIKEVVGHGGFAVVYEVEWLGEIYGQKEFFGVDKCTFAKEAAIQARLRHPNLLQLICCTSKPSKNRCSLVMELMDTDLRSRIDDRLKDGFNPPFPLFTCMDIMLQIAKGMEYLHSLHIMHRDLKSANLLITNQASMDQTSSECRMRVKIADFGMSKAKNQSSKYTTRHAGTTYWRAPEVFDVHPESEFQGKSTAKYTKKADVYSFAMVCYEIFSGNVPFDDGGKLGDLHQRLLRGERPKLPSSCPAYLVSYIRKCWHGDPVQRPTFAQISRTLRHLKGVLLTRTADPGAPLSLSARSFTQIEEKLEKKMGSQWPSTMSAWCSTRTMTISFEMSWYKVMEHTLTQKEAEKALQTMSVRMISRGLISMSGVFLCGNFFHTSMLKCQLLKLKHGVRLTVRRFNPSLNFWLAKCCLSSGPTDSALKRTISQTPSTHPMSPTPPTPLLVKERVKVHLNNLMTSETLVTEMATEPWPLEMGEEGPGSIGGLKDFCYSELAQATSMFDVSARIGACSFRSVYKGILPDGKVVAVKVLSARNMRDGATFLSELDLVSRVRHRNLVSLLGYCDDGDVCMLVYEYMSGGDLGQWLYGEHSPLVLSWAHRYQIACGVASALNYLHNGISPRIVHRDVKPSNILLDEAYKGCLSDFGIALREGTGDKGADVVTGTVVYMDPEYVYTLQGGPEVDVYSFGVVLLQLVSGRKAFKDQITVMDYVLRLQEEGRILDAVDERLRVDGYLDNEDEILRLLLLGLMCCQYAQDVRPTMHEVVQILHEGFIRMHHTSPTT